MQREVCLVWTHTPIIFCSTADWDDFVGDDQPVEGYEDAVYVSDVVWLLGWSVVLAVTTRTTTRG